MPGPHMIAEELAEELGRSTSWLYEHWRELAKGERMPHPLHGGRTPLVWSRAQVYAWLDRDIPADQRAIVAAYRAAAAAAVDEPHVGGRLVAIADGRRRLDRRFEIND